MSNRSDGANWIVIDATDTQVGGDNPGIGPKSNLRITGIVWLATPAKAIADTNKLNILYGNKVGDIVIAVDAQITTTGSLSVFYQKDWHYKPWIVPGLYIEDLDGGELQIFLD